MCPEAGKPSGEGVSTPDEEQPASAISANIKAAIRVAESSQFCRELREAGFNSDGDYLVEAYIGPPVVSLSDSETRYKVRFLIPKTFPYTPTHVVPLEPELKWYPHQNGDWPNQARANVMCPPQLDEIHLDELLQPYIRHAHTWISDALADRLTTNDEHYELPDIRYLQAGAKEVVYVEGGTRPWHWVRGAAWGRALVRKIKGEREGKVIYLVRKLEKHGGGDSFEPELREDVFGAVEADCWAPWIFAGNPVVAVPHRPAISWEDLGEVRQQRILKAIETTCRLSTTVPYLLVAFGVPRRWGEAADRIAWGVIHLAEWDSGELRTKPNGFRSGTFQLWPATRRLIAVNKQLRWIGPCRDVSRDSLTSRSDGGDVDWRVGLVGVGALGSMLARGISGLDPAHLVLVDKEVLEPGNLARHEALPFLVQEAKAGGMARQLSPKFLSSEVKSHKCDGTNLTQQAVVDLRDCDLVIDATGDAGVHSALMSSVQLNGTALAVCYVKPGPDYGVLFLRRPGSTATLDAALEQLLDSLGEDTRMRFETNGTGQTIWPEAGCYQATFPAPYHRMRMMADALLEVIIAFREAGENQDSVTLIAQVRREDAKGTETRIEAQLIL